MSFLRRVAGRSLRDRVRSSVTREELGVEPLLLHVERSQLRWLGHLFRMPPGRLPGEVFRACPTGRRPRGRPRTRWRDYVSRLAWERLGIPQKSWRKLQVFYNVYHLHKNMDTVTPTNEDYTWPDYDNYTEETTGQIYAPCNQADAYGFAQRYSPVMYSLVFVLALLGNILVLCVIRRYRSSQSGGACAFSLTDTFLLHLAISDLLLAFTLPLFAVQWAHKWVFGLAICKISGALFSLNRYSGILFLACISFDRYLAIVHAISSGWKRNTCHAQIACAFIWVLCLGLSAVDIIYKQVEQVQTETSKELLLCLVYFPPENSTQWQIGLQLVSVILGFGLPLLIMLYCYIRIFRSLCNATRRQKRKSLRLIVSLVSVFVICWAPYSCFQLTDSLVRLKLLTESCGLQRVLDIGTLITESVGLSHCALNPLLYGFVGVKFRRELARMCKGLLIEQGWLGMEKMATGTELEVDLGGLFLHNGTYDYDNDYTYEEELEPRKAAAVLLPFVFSIVLLLGISGHALIFVFLGLKKHSWSISDIFVLHLGLTDVLLLITLPSWAAQAALPLGWCCGLSWCRINGTLFNISFFCGMFLLLCIVAERYLSIVRSVQLLTQRSTWLAQIICVVIWLVSTLLSIPDWVSMLYKEEQNMEELEVSPDSDHTELLRLLAIDGR
ncbi:hypothetical protein WMY93_026483 [Mugilogobius chulae]|uniref:G-protein coupled receptors family 1 profile domain-containing protein n=1 Tax=Mugilogobius chulae TaxID=88201 RepID=A0AAW0MXJ1_9GOBI